MNKNLKIYHVCCSEIFEHTTKLVSNNTAYDTLNR